MSLRSFLGKMKKGRNRSCKRRRVTSIRRLKKNFSKRKYRQAKGLLKL